MLDYDLEAADYDQTRGGAERARAAAGAVLELVPAGTRVLVDVACGTGIVSELLTAPDRMVLGVDPSAGMLELARPRLGGDGRAMRGDATRLPLADGSVDAVTFMWLLHLLDEAVVTAAIAEAARVLRPGGVLVTTVNKNTAQFDSPSDVGAVLGAAYREYVPVPSDDFDQVRQIATAVGLELAGTSGYVGHNQGKSPRQWVELLHGESGWSRRATAEQIAEICQAVAELPDQDVRRGDPVYKLAGFRLAAG